MDGISNEIMFSLQFFSKRSASSLSVVSVQATDIPPKELVTYTKQTQTASTGGVERDGMHFLFLHCLHAVWSAVKCYCLKLK